MMLVKQDSCRISNTESFLCPVFVMLTLLSVIFFIGKGILPKKHANICLLSLFFPLNIHIVHIHVSVDVMLHSFFEKALFK